MDEKRKQMGKMSQEEYLMNKGLIGQVAQ